MSDNSRNENIVHFVRNTLGCQCADEVFHSIELESSTTPNAGIGFVKIVIGKRLLIYVAKSVSDGLINSFIPELAEMGRLERDNKGYNRFRLVMVRKLSM